MLIEDLDLENPPPNNYNDKDMADMAAGVLRIAEQRAYDEAAEQGGKISHDQIMTAAQSVLQELESQIGELIQQEFSGQS